MRLLSPLPTTKTATPTLAATFGVPSTDALLERERVEAERLMNRVRAVVLVMLGGAALMYAPKLTPGLRWVNVSVLVPMLLWTAWQHVYIHRAHRIVPWLTTANAAIDSSAVTALLFGYGLMGFPQLALTSPIWVAYFVILAARPFTSSARRAAIASIIAVAQYAMVAVVFVIRGHLSFDANILAAAMAGRTSAIDEVAKLLLLAAGGAIATYATAWNERTLRRAARDITARKTLEEQLAYQALHDPLTGLANRVLFQDRVVNAFQGGGEPTDQIAVLCLDVDEFKTVNDSLGHGCGDQLLAALAHRLLNATRGCDTVARLGGDEFAVLLGNAGAEADAIVVAERIAASLRAPFTLDDRQISVSASIGIARAAAGDDAETLLRNADVAMYQAKNEGRGRHAIFELSMHQELVDRIALETDLREGIARGELRVLYQPIVELATSRMVSAEALVRWAHPQRGILAPAAFIPMAEETGLIVPLGRAVLRAACAEAAGWSELARPHQAPSVTVNLSALQFQQDDLAADVAAALADSGLDPARLTLEITESVVMQNIDATMQQLHALKALGVQLAVDDFGTGYSSLGSLQRFPIDILKIDKSFIDGITHGGNDAALARTIIALGDMLHLRTVAEGIEHADQHQLVRSLGCQLGQGYLFAKPIAANEIRRFVQAAGVMTPTTPARLTPASGLRAANAPAIAATH